jgi:hypothetical protein
MLPSLHTLSMGAVAERPAAPRSKAKAKANGSGVKASGKGPPRRRVGRFFLLEDDYSSDDDRDGDRDADRASCDTFEHVVTQEQAARWFNMGTPLGIGASGVAKKYKVPEDELRGGPWVAVKQLRNLPMAKKEQERHLNVWNGSHYHCRMYLSMPACMEFPDEETASGYYFTVQTLVDGAGLDFPTDTESLYGTCSKHTLKLWALPPIQKQKIARAYGDMVGCFVKAGILHNDLHGENILVTHNLNHLEDGELAERLYFKFHTIDWGLSWPISPGSYDENGDVKSVCLYRDPFNRGDSRSPRSDKYQRDWRLMFGIENERGDCRGETWHGMYLLMLSLFRPNSWEEELPVDGVPRAQILDWARRAYLARLNVNYPPDALETMTKLILEECTIPKDERRVKLTHFS